MNNKVMIYNSLLTRLVKAQPGTEDFVDLQRKIEKAWDDLSTAERSEAYEISGPLRARLNKPRGSN